MPLKEGSMSRPRSRLASREYASFGASTESILTRSDSFYRSKHRGDIAELLDIVKTQGLPRKDGAGFEMKKKAPLPGIGESTRVDILPGIGESTRVDMLMDNSSGTPRIVIDPSRDPRSHSSLSMDLSNGPSHLTASCDEFAYLTPRLQLPYSGAAYSQNTLSKSMLSRSMEMFPRHTPRKTYRLRPMGQRRLSSVPESRLSALAGSRAPKAHDIEEISDVALPNFNERLEPGYNQHARTRRRGRVSRPEVTRPEAPEPAHHPHALDSDCSSDEAHSDEVIDGLERSDVELSESLPHDPRYAHRQKHHRNVKQSPVRPREQSPYRLREQSPARPPSLDLDSSDDDRAHYIEF